MGITYVLKTKLYFEIDIWVFLGTRTFCFIWKSWAAASFSLHPWSHTCFLLLLNYAFCNDQGKFTCSSLKIEFGIIWLFCCSPLYHERLPCLVEALASTSNFLWFQIYSWRPWEIEAHSRLIVPGKSMFILLDNIESWRTVTWCLFLLS